MQDFLEKSNVKPQVSCRLVSALPLALLFAVASIGCENSKPPAPAPTGPDKLEVTRVDPSIDHLRVSHISGEWGNDPEIEWDTAITLGEMSKLAYDDEATRRKVLTQIGFTKIELLDRGPKSGFIAIADDVAVIAFRGTDDPADWIANFDFRQLANAGNSRKVHSGFQGAYGAFASQVHEQLNDHKPKYVWITGHSLGGAMAACCAYDLLQEDVPLTAVVTFGQPRIGNEALAQFLDDKLGDKYLRFMNEGDPVVILPPCFGVKLPAYWHSGRRAWFLWGRLFTIEGPTLFAEPAPGTEQQDDTDSDPGEVDGMDKYESMTEDEFLELQKQLKATPASSLQGVASAPSVGAAPEQPALESQGMVGGVKSFFSDRIGEHNMDEYLKQLNDFCRRDLAE